MRFAVYYAPPPRSAFWRAGCEWLGWDAAAGMRVLPPGLPGALLARLAPLLRRPAHYGWHATLKAPFALADGITLDDLLGQCLALAQRFRAFDVVLETGMLAGASVLRPTLGEAALNELAEACVRELYELGVPAPARTGLSDEEAALHERWGYPYVLDHFRFHMTLAAATREAPLQAAIQRAARQHFDGLLQMSVAGLAVFAEPRPDEPFRYLAECRFDGQVIRHAR